MIARQYSRKIDVFSTGITPDGYGGNTAADIQIGSFWAEVKQLSSFKDNTVGKSDLKKTYSFKIRTNTIITQDPNSLSIVYRGSKYVVNDLRYDDELFREVTIIANGG